MLRDPRIVSIFIAAICGANVLLLSACSDDPGLPTVGSGGVPASAGGMASTANGGSTPVSQGGAMGGGTASTGTTSGGTSAGGSSNGVGGQDAKGGTTNNGGTQSIGGTKATGGTKAIGGSTTAGGSKATGGAGNGGTGTGGSKAVGGNAGTGGGSATACPTDAETKFSFFLLSQAALQKDSGQTDGYGGDLGGLTGADAICQRVAERSSACQKNKTWRAFLSTPTVNAKDRIGKGPWHDRLGRLVAANLSNLLTERPTGADSSIVNDLPNEEGVPNHAPNGVQVDNHQILTGTGTDGNVYKQSGSGGFPGGETSCGPMNQETWSAQAATCWGWTTKEGKGCPRVGHSWPRVGSGVHWISVWNEGGCAPGGTLSDTGGLDGTRRVGSAGGYGGFYCFAVTEN